MDRSNSIRALEVTILFAEGLPVDSATKSNLLVTVRAESINSYSTCTAREGTGNNNNPTWNHKLLVDVPVHSRSVTFEVKSKGSSTRGAKDVGVARVALSELVGAPPVLSYRLRDWEGRRSGVLNFSVRVVNSPEKMVPSCGFQMMSSSTGSGRVVTGVPVWCQESNV